MNFDDSEWAALFPGDSSRTAYQRAMRNLTPLDWSVLESSQGDLLDLLVDRVSAETGSAVILGLALLFRDNPEADRLSREFLRLIMSRVAPRRARTILVTLAAAWKSARREPIHRGPELLGVEMSRVLRRILLADVEQLERAALRQLQELLGQQA